MITSEFEYNLLSELITMPDRELAQKIELHIWYNCSFPQPRILAKYLKALKDSISPDNFHELAAEIINQSGMEFVKVEKGIAVGQESRTPCPKPPGYVEITHDILLAAQLQEPTE